MKKLILIFLNFLAIYLMCSGNVQNIIVGFTIIILCYLFLLFNFISWNPKNYQIAPRPVIENGRIGRASSKKQFKFEKITTYKVDEELLTKDKWEELKVKLNSFSIEFLKKNFPDVEWITTIAVSSYDQNSAGSFINIISSQNILFDGKLANQILLNEAFIYAVLKYNDFGIIQPILEHELVHYALWYQGKKFNDGDSDFEEKIAELNIRSNNAEVVNIYSLGIIRNKTENGIEDVLTLIIPPSKTDKENEEALELYKKKYDLKETA